jgi:aminoglycoside phosphotransferase (APT) family kinase protein
VERSIGNGARVNGFRRLTGGIGSAVHRLTIVDRSGGRRSVVLRQYERDEDVLTEREARALAAVASTPVPAPQVIAFDPVGAAAGGHPSLLMTRERGDVFLTPADEDDWIEQIAAVLVLIHELDLDAAAYERWGAISERPPPSSAQDVGLWRDVLRLLNEDESPVPHTFIHRDFQHFNMLWARERLTSVIDWTWTSRGPREIDVGHCRLNLAVLFSAATAERFRLRYEALSGHDLHPWWDLYCLAAYSDHWQEFIPIQVAGRRPVDVAGMPARVEDVMRATLARL